MARENRELLRQDQTELKLAAHVCHGDGDGVEAMLEAGASVNGCVRLRPLAMAAFYGDLEMVKLLIDNGADLDAPMKNPAGRVSLSRCYLPFSGECAAHVVAYSARDDILRVLLEAGANPNARNSEGITPLMAICATLERTPWRETTRALLEAGGDLELVDNTGWTALLHAATGGNPDIISMIVSMAPNTLNLASTEGETSLYLAACNDNPSAVSRLLAAGATHPGYVGQDRCPLAVAVVLGYKEVVEVLVADGLEAIGGLAYAIPLSLAGAVIRERPTILRTLLNAEGEEKQAMWTRQGGLAGFLLHYAAGNIVHAAVRVLLAAGADATATDSMGQRAIDVIGTMDIEHPPISPLSPRIPTRRRDPVEEAAIRRTLERAPAFRARSWAWPDRVDGGKGGGGESAAAGAGAVVSSGKGRKKASLGVRVFRTKDRKLFVRRIGR